MWSPLDEAEFKSRSAFFFHNKLSTYYLTLIAILKQLEQLHACLNIKMVEHCVRTRFDAEQLQSKSTFCAEGELSADSSVLAWARMPCSRLFLRHHVRAAATMRTSRSLAHKCPKTKGAAYRPTCWEFISALTFPELNSLPKLLRVKGQAGDILTSAWGTWEFSQEITEALIWMIFSLCLWCFEGTNERSCGFL